MLGTVRCNIVKCPVGLERRLCVYVCGGKTERNDKDKGELGRSLTVKCLKYPLLSFSNGLLF